MRRANAALMLLVSTCHFALAHNSQDRDPTADRDKIANATAEISNAYLAREPAPFERIYLEDHTAVRGKPIFNLRAQLIAMTTADSVLLRAGKRPEYETLRYTSAPAQIRLYGSSAILTASKEHYWQYRGQKCLTRTQNTELWVKVQNEWKIAASHANTFECDSRPYYPVHSAVAALAARTKPPVNSDQEGERQIRELIRAVVAARASVNEPFDVGLSRYVAESFVSTDVEGKVGSDRGIIRLLQVPLPNRSSVFRTQTDAIVLYGDAAIYTFRVRKASETEHDPAQQVTVFFARTAAGWKIVAAHAGGNAE